MESVFSGAFLVGVDALVTIVGFYLIDVKCVL